MCCVIWNLEVKAYDLKTRDASRRDNIENGHGQPQIQYWKVAVYYFRELLKGDEAEVRAG